MQLCFLVWREVIGVHIPTPGYGCVGVPPPTPIWLLSTPWSFHPASTSYTWLTSENITPDINPTAQVLIRRQNTTEVPVSLFLLGTPDLLLTKCFLLCVNIRLDCKCPSEIGSGSSPHLLPSGQCRLKSNHMKGNSVWLILQLLRIAFL